MKTTMRRLQAVAAVGLLAGCAGIQTPGALPSSAQLQDAKRETHSGDLLYVIDTWGAKVDIYAYPGSTLTGSLTGFVRPSGLCVDKAGDVFVTDEKAYDIVEFKHGGTKPIATLKESETSPGGCAVDPTTGDLAVANEYLWGATYFAGNLAIFKHARGKPKIYKDYPAIRYYNSCTYDQRGNLYVEGDTPDKSALAVFPKGATKFTNVKVDKSFYSWGGVQWDGKYLALQRYSRGHNVIYRVAVSGSKGSVVGTVPIEGPRFVGGFWIEGDEVIVPSGRYRVNEIGTWSYPGGGVEQTEFRVRGTWFVAAAVSHG